jgi:uncharacterized membrane protein YphA (DoxX/SURF4 family)
MRRVQEALRLCGRLALAGVLLYAGLVKVGDPTAFAQDIANYRILPPALVAPAAALLPGIEMVVGLALLAGIWLRSAAVASAALLGVFTVALGSALGRGIDVACGCFGHGETPATWWTFGRDLLLFGTSVALAFAAEPLARPAPAALPVPERDGPDTQPA